MATINDLYAALNGDVAEVQAVTDAQAALDAATTALSDAQASVADTENVTTEEQDAIDAAQATVDAATTALADAQGNVDAGDSVALADALSITDFGMVSNEAARAILAARGEEVKFEEPVNVESDYNMNPISE